MTRRNLADRSIGKKLKTQREKLGIDLLKVHNALKIRPAILEDIENDKFDNIGSPVYVKGILKNYAKFLKLDPEQFAGFYARDWAPIASKTTTKLKKTERQRKIILDKRMVFGVIAFGILLYALNILSGLVNSAFQKPFLNITFPVIAMAGETVNYATTGETFYIEGTTENSTLITINDLPITLDVNYHFKSKLFPVVTDKTEFIIKAQNSVGSTSVVTLNLSKAEKFEAKGKVVLFKVINEPQFILVKADGNILFNDLAEQNYELNFEFLSELEIQTLKPVNISLTIDSVTQKLTKEREIFKIIDKNLRQE